MLSRSNLTAAAGFISVVWAAGAAGPAAAGPPADTFSAVVAPCTVAPAQARFSRQDIDNDQRSERVVGVPSAVAGSKRAGVVDIHLSRGGSQRVGEAFFAGVPAADGDAFGSQVSVVSLDSDTCLDLAIASPGSVGGRGAVLLAKGSESGLRSDGARRLLGQTPGDRFGSAIAVDGKHLYVGAPGRSVAGKASAGAVYHYLKGTDGQYTLVEAITQDSAGVPGVAEAGDRFGSVLTIAGSSRLVVGVPNESAGSKADAGLVEILFSSSATHRLTGRALIQGAAGVPGVAEAGDRFGASLSSAKSTDGLVVGSPGEDIGSSADAGQVQVFAGISQGTFPTGPTATITQDTPGVWGVVEAGDQFGAAVLAGNFAQCSTDQVAIGAPGEDIGTTADAGTVSLLFPLGATVKTPECMRAYYQGNGGLGGAIESGDRVGASLSELTPTEDSLADFPDPSGLVIGIPGEGVGAAAHAGGVMVLQLLNERVEVTGFGDSGGPVANERFGQNLVNRP